MSQKNALNIIQAALVMAMEGTSRATASDISERATKDFESKSIPSEIGQLLRQMGISSATSHGKTRLILDTDELSVIKDKLSATVIGTGKQLEDTIKQFGDISSRIRTLESQYKEALSRRMKEKELVQLIEHDRRTPSRLPELEHQADRIRQEADRVDELQKEIDEMAKKVKVLPMLEGRKVALQNSIRRYQDEEAKIKTEEARLGQYLEDLKKRQAWVTFVDLDFNIQKLKDELKEITDQINERRSLLQKLLGTNKVR